MARFVFGAGSSILGGVLVMTVSPRVLHTGETGCGGVCCSPFPADTQRSPAWDSKSLHVRSKGVASFERVLLLPLGKKSF